MRVGATGVMGFLLSTAAAPLAAQLIPSAIPFAWEGIYVGQEFLVNTDTANNQKRPAVAAGLNGDHLVVWNSDHEATGFFAIYGQLYDRHGVEVGGQFQIADNGGNIDYTPDVASGGNGNYIVTWARFTPTVTNSETWARLFDPVGAALTAAFQVNTFTTSHQQLPRVDADDGGGFTVVYQSQGQDGDGFGVYGRSYDASAVAVTPEFRINSEIMANQDRPSVAKNDAGFTVVFRHNDTDLVARDYDAASLPLGNQYTVFSGTGPYGIGDVARIEKKPANNLFAGEWNGDIWGRRNTGNPFLIAAGDAAGPATGPRLSRSWDTLRVAASYTRYGRDPNDPSTADVFGRTYDVSPSGGLSERDGEFQANTSVSGEQWVADVAIGPHGELRYVWQSGDFIPLQDGDEYSVWRREGGDPESLPPDVDTLSSGGTSNLNTVWELGERVKFRMKLRNNYSSSLNGLGGTFSASFLQGSSPATVVVDDSTASWGTVPGDATADCHTATGDCYEATVSGPRPGPHWDEALEETLSTGVQKQWVFHIGESFADVPTSNLFYAFIENLFHNGVTAGGACGGYCPTDGVKRQQMAVFLLKARFPLFTPPPATGTIFDDVPASNPFAAWIEALYLLGITGGCSGGPPPAPISFCPDAIVNRQQMAVFLLKTLEGFTYTPPACTGVFQDVLCTNPFSAWIEELYARQVTGGCVASPLQYCPTNPTNRQQMAAFLVKTFGLLLYGP